MLSIRHNFLAEWAKFTSGVPTGIQTHEIKINLRPEHFPFWSQGKSKKLIRVAILAQSNNSSGLTNIITTLKADAIGMNNISIKPIEVMEQSGVYRDESKTKDFPTVFAQLGPNLHEQLSLSRGPPFVSSFCGRPQVGSVSSSRWASRKSSSLERRTT